MPAQVQMPSNLVVANGQARPAFGQPLHMQPASSSSNLQGQTPQQAPQLIGTGTTSQSLWSNGVPSTNVQQHLTMNGVSLNQDQAGTSENVADSSANAQSSSNPI